MPTSSLNNYDAIADIYDADMGLNMLLPDVSYYTECALASPGPVLELGCGTGRILGALLNAGVMAIGIDRSAVMLAKARQKIGSFARLIQMDMRQLAFGCKAQFSLVLLPYSLVTYLLTDKDWVGLSKGLKAALHPNGQIVLDAFIPRNNLVYGQWLKDYARNFNGSWLVRHKRIRPTSSHQNCIERRYRMIGALSGRTLITSEKIRAYSPNELVDFTERYLGKVLKINYDYGTHTEEKHSQFCCIQAQICEQ